MNVYSPLPPYVRPLNRWLTLAAALVMLMVVLGGVTRLTESGLSIVEWKLVSGIVPPMSETAWQEEFELYKTSPQFQKVNRSFSVADFQQIYWLEYLHRLLGRIIGLVIVGGTLYYRIRGYFTPPLFRRMMAISVLVAAQGTVGWVMVASGLVDQPRVAPIKLALHLLLAFALYGSLLWTRWQMLGHPRITEKPKVALAARALWLLIVAQIGLGALVAGLRAGLTYNSFPLMDGQWVPSGLYTLEPWWLNHLENITMVQFQHRLGAIAVLLAGISFVVWSWKKAEIHPALTVLLVIICLQFALGIATLLSGVSIWLASAHQLVALFLFGVLTRINYRISRKYINS